MKYISRQNLIATALVTCGAVVLWLSRSYVPLPGMVMIAIATAGGLSGYLLYEHVRLRKSLPAKVVVDQLALAGLLLIIFSFTF